MKKQIFHDEAKKSIEDCDKLLSSLRREWEHTSYKKTPSENYTIEIKEKFILETKEKSNVFYNFSHMLILAHILFTFEESYNKPFLYCTITRLYISMCIKKSFPETKFEQSEEFSLPVETAIIGRFAGAYGPRYVKRNGKREK